MDTPRLVTPAQHFINFSLRIGAIQFIPEGRLLDSGRMSPYFFNSGLFSTNKSLRKLAEAYAATIGAMGTPNVIFGPAYKGIPLAVAVALAIGDRVGMTSWPEVGYAFNRKEKKDHRDGGSIVGASLEGQETIVVDDAMTTSKNCGDAVEIVRKNGGNVIGCVIAFDRQERGRESEMSAVQEFEKKYGVPVRAAATLADLILYLEKVPPRGGDVPRVGEMLEKILKYKKQYGAV